MEDKSINERKIDETVARCKKMLDLHTTNMVKQGRIMERVGLMHLDHWITVLLNLTRQRIQSIYMMLLTTCYCVCYFHCQVITMNQQIQMNLQV